MKKTVCLLFTVTVLLMVAGCESGGSSNGTTYAIGDTGPSGVGIVFYVINDGLHGLEAAPDDQVSGAWDDFGQVTEVDNTQTEIGTGLDNTDAIIAHSGISAEAAQECKAYNGGGLADWFLPSKDALNQLYEQKDKVGGFDNSLYWSSSELDYNDAWCQDFTDGSQSTVYKGDAYSVRAVRGF